MSDVLIVCCTIIVMCSLIIWAYLYSVKLDEAFNFEQIKLKGEIDEKISKQNWEQKQALKMMERQKYYDLEKLRLEMLPAPNTSDDNMQQVLLWLESLKQNQNVEIRNDNNKPKDKMGSFIYDLSKMDMKDIMLKYPDLYEDFVKYATIQDGEIVK